MIIELVGQSGFAFSMGITQSRFRRRVFKLPATGTRQVESRVFNPLCSVYMPHLVSFQPGSRNNERQHDRAIANTKTAQQSNKYIVVVDKGRHGEQDTLYVIPAGAPVIFEDQYGRELSR